MANLQQEGLGIWNPGRHREHGQPERVRNELQLFRTSTVEPAGHDPPMPTHGTRWGGRGKEGRGRGKRESKSLTIEGIPYYRRKSFTIADDARANRCFIRPPWVNRARRDSQVANLAASRPQPSRLGRMRQQSVGWHYLSTATCLTNRTSFVLCVFRRLKDHHTLPHGSLLLKKARVRQVVLRQGAPPESGQLAAEIATARRPLSCQGDGGTPPRSGGASAPPCRS